MKPEDSLLGKTVAASRHYAPEILHPIPRRLGRESLGLAGLPSFHGADIWHGYELSWLDSDGKPEVAMARVTVPCDSPCIVESKSFKLYLNSLNYTRFETPALAAAVIARDLSAAAGAAVTVQLISPAVGGSLMPAQLEGVLLDDLPLTMNDYHYEPALLQPAAVTGDAVSKIRETLVTHLFRSNCPVTGQPDWASIRISYEGPPLDHQSVLAYLVSYRDHQEFHEQCVERIFTDIQRRCVPERLCVEAFFTRRGGLDICPVRSSDACLPPPLRLIRQ
jgi:7-cyano-7-deazaguanine reductase